MQALSTLRAFIEQQGGDCNTFYEVGNQVHMLVANNAKHGSIMDFFSSATVQLNQPISAASCLCANCLYKQFFYIVLCNVVVPDNRISRILS